MSRCFPYPPPGFEKKARDDQSSDLLSKEQKVRKHKKERRDKVKKEDKEEKHKDKKRDKHNEKKDRKEKHKDKKRDREKNRTSDDKSIEGQTSDHTQQKDEKREANQVLENVNEVDIFKAEEANNSRYIEELGRRIENEKKMSANRMLENSSSSIPKGVEGLGTNIFSKEHRISDGVGQPTEKANHRHQVSNNYQSLPSGNQIVTKFCKEQRRADNHQASHNHQSFRNGNPMVSNFRKEQGRANGLIQPVESVNQKHQTLPHRTPVVPNFANIEKERVDEIPRAVAKGNFNHQALFQTPAEKDEVKNIEGKERGKDGQADNGHGDRHLDREREKKKKKRKEKNRDKEREKEEKKKKRNKGNGEDSQKEIDMRKDTGRDEVNSLNFKPRAPESSIENFADNYGNSKKRKEIEMNVFLHENEVPPNKLSRPVSSYDKQNGKKMEFDHIHTAAASIKHVIPTNVIAEKVLHNKVHKINGTVVSPPSAADSRSLLTVPKTGTTNSFPHEVDASPNKIRRPEQQNGKKMDFDRINTASASISHGMPNIITAGRVQNNKEHKINGTVVDRSSPADSRPLLTTPKTGTINGIAVIQPSATDSRPSIINGVAVAQSYPAGSMPLIPVDSSIKSNKVFTKPSHPDMKFLNQVYSIPKIEQFPDYDDQDWLFGSRDYQSKPNKESKAQETPNVWAQGLKIESADVFGLPYVIPY